MGYRGHNSGNISRIQSLAHLAGGLHELAIHILPATVPGGIYQAKVMAETGKSFVVFDRYHKIGGVWEFYGNDCSRVNTSEMLGADSTLSVVSCWFSNGHFPVLMS